ncbi:cupin domain-containing protein [Arthrobacter sp. R4-81]
MNDTTSVNLGEHVAKATSSTPGQTEVSFKFWEDNGLRTGVWEATPGTFTSTREGYNEICQILSGTATITDENGSFDIGPGSLFVTPAGWRGSWTVHETLRKMAVVQDLPAQPAD